MQTAIDWIASASGWTLRNSLEATVLIVLVAALSLIWRERLSSGFRAALWTAVGVRLLLPFAPESSLSVYNLLPARAEVSQSESVFATGAPAAADVIATPATVPIPLSEPLPEPASLSMVSLLALGWLVGALAILGFAVVRQIQTWRRIRQLPEPEHPRLRKILRRCVKETGVRRQPRIVEAGASAGVAVFGFLRPSHVIVPRGLGERYTESEIRGIFLHELAHIRRGDLLWNWLTLAVQALHWFNPLVWWAGRRFLAERELICDGFALRRMPPSERRNYGMALLKMLEFGIRPASAPNPALLPFFSQKSELKHRLTMIKKSQSISPIVQTVATVVAVAACAMTFTSAQADEREGDSRRSAESERGNTGERDGDARREGDAPRDGERRGEREGDAPREGERRGEREGDAPREGERRGEREGDAPRDGERRGEREGDAPREGDKAVVRDGELKIRVFERVVVIGEREVPLANLRRTLEEHPVKSAVVVADSRVPLQSVATVMNALRDSGVSDVRLQAEGGEGAPAREGVRDGEGAPRAGQRDGEGDAPRRDAPREGDAPRRDAPRDGDAPSRDAPREGDAPRRDAPREGDAPRRDAPREGDAPRRDAPREGDAPRRDAPREGDAPRRDAPREGDASREGARDGDAPAREGARDGDAPAREGARDGARDGAPAREGARDGDA